MKSSTMIGKYVRILNDVDTDRLQAAPDDRNEA
ncbi:MAG: hypothetical protein IRD7MM_02035 [Candidatus Midichloria mitochondrii]